jgi:hypothetical protein
VVGGAPARASEDSNELFEFVCARDEELDERVWSEQRGVVEEGGVAHKNLRSQYARRSGD